jgi:hypothetical protein
MTMQRKIRSKRKAEPASQASIDAEAMPIDREAAATLIQSWLADNSGYDETAWPTLQADIEANRLAGRARFHE